MKKKMLALVAAATIATGLAACGGDDDGDDTSAASETTAAAISEADFVAQGNAICKAGNSELGAGPQDGDLEAFVTDTLVPNIQGQIDALTALGAPEGQEEEVSQFLEDAQTQLDALESDPASISESTFDEANQQATALGLDECAS
jgi:hypothetical protein